MIYELLILDLDDPIITFIKTRKIILFKLTAKCYDLEYTSFFTQLLIYKKNFLP